MSKNTVSIQLCTPSKFICFGLKSSTFLLYILSFCITTSIISVAGISTVVASPQVLIRYYRPALPTVTSNDRTLNVKEGFTYTFRIQNTGTLTGTTVKVNIVETMGIFLSDEERGIRDIEMEPGSNNKDFRVTVLRNKESKMGGVITLTITEISNGVVLPHDSIDYSTFVLNIDNYDPAKLSISSENENRKEQDGNVEFKITADKVPLDNPLDIKYITTQTGNFINNPPSTADKSTVESFEFTTSDPIHATLSITLSNDMIDESDGSITVKLIELSTYDLGTNFSITVSINDNDTPVLSIEDGTSVNESQSTSFTIKSDIQIIGEKTVYFKITDDASSNFLAADEKGDSLAKVLTFAQISPYNATLEIPLDDDQIDEDDGEIMMEIVSAPSNSTSDYNLTMEPGGTSATAQISDNDSPPTLTIQRTHSIVESSVAEKVVILITLSTISNKTISLDYETEDGTATFRNDYTEIGRTTLNIPASTKESSIEVSIINDAGIEELEMFSVKFSNAINASFASGNEFITRISIIDDDDPNLIPSISISSVNDEITAGDSVEFILTTTPVPKRNLQVSVSLTRTGNISTWRFPSIITITGPETIFRIPTRDSGFSENSGRIIATLNEVENSYMVEQIAPVSVNIVDNSPPDDTTPRRISIAENVVNALLTLNETNGRTSSPPVAENVTSIPIVSISTVESKIEEGSMVQFQLLASERISRIISVNLNVLDSGNFIKGTIPQTIHLPPTNSPYLVFNQNRG